MTPLKLTIDEVAETSRESRAIVYDAIAAGHLKTFVVGRRRFARPDDVRNWIDFLQRESDAGRPVAYRRRVK